MRKEKWPKKLPREKEVGSVLTNLGRENCVEGRRTRREDCFGHQGGRSLRVGKKKKGAERTVASLTHSPFPPPESLLALAEKKEVEVVLSFDCVHW